MVNSLVFILCVWLLQGHVQGLEHNEERLLQIEGNVHDLYTEVHELATQVKTLTKTVEKLVQFMKTNDHGHTKPRLFSDSSLDEKRIDIKDEGLPKAMNDSNLEERVTALEFQMENVHEDIATINNDIETLNASLADLDEDVEAQITIIQADQVIQDERLLNVEDDIEVVQITVETLEEKVTNIGNSHDQLNASFIELDLKMEGLNNTVYDLVESVNDLEETDIELTTAIDELMIAVEDVSGLAENLDARLLKLELNGTVAFHAVVGEYTTIPEDSIVPFSRINVNLGKGYNNETGTFTVPPGGDGLYFFYVHVRLNGGKIAGFDMIYNNTRILCVASEDETDSTDVPAASCGAVVTATAGDTVYVTYAWGTDDTPLISGIWPFNTLTGFRVAPQ